MKQCEIVRYPAGKWHLPIRCDKPATVIVEPENYCPPNTPDRHVCVEHHAEWFGPGLRGMWSIA